MKARYDAKHSYVQYHLSDRVILKLQLHYQFSLSSNRYTKLSSRYCGPFPILAKVGCVAYKLDLPSSSKLHLVFLVSYFKPFHGTSIPMTLQFSLNPLYLFLPKAKFTIYQKQFLILIQLIFSTRF